MEKSVAGWGMFGSTNTAEHCKQKNPECTSSNWEIKMKKHHKYPFTASIAAISIATFSITSFQVQAHCGACEADHAAKTAEKEMSKDIVDTAVAAGSFSTLVAAVQKAGLVDTLKGEGPFTVFAPTDEAFAKLPEGTVETLLQNPEKLKQILTYHVIPGKVMAEKVVGIPYAKTAAGSPVFITVKDGSVYLNQKAKVVKTDIATSNGVIHVIDQVILPLDIVETAKQAGAFSTLVTALKATDLVGALQAEGPLTVFAPTDEAFAKLPAGTIEALLADKDKLSSILTYHVAEGKLLAGDVVSATEIASLQGSKIAVNTADGVKVDNANVIMTDIMTSNGIIHVIDEVIIPD
jgi:uncharacterized surface protein with fasciclin (FAS1) repeats